MSEDRCAKCGTPLVWHVRHPVRGMPMMGPFGHVVDGPECHEIRHLREAANLEIDAEFDHWAPLQTKLEEQAAEILRLRECVRASHEWIHHRQGCVCLPGTQQNQQCLECPRFTHPLEKP